MTPNPVFPDDLHNYAPWVSQFGLVQPYGKCQCGCGEDVPLSIRTKLDKGRIKGMPIRFLHSHWHNKATLEDALWEFLSPGEPDECWEWQKKLGAWGYGAVCFRGEIMPAHRASYEIHKGPIPEGLKVLHRCDNPPCCNPNHLFLGTDAENVADKVGKKRHAFGERAASAKLAEADINEIRQLHKSGFSASKIAATYKVSPSTINRIVKGKGWTHVPVTEMLLEVQP